jgi:hypothetical protein
MINYFFAPLAVMLAIGIAGYLYASRMMARKRWHEALTDEAIFDAAERRMCGVGNPGFCLACGNERDGTAPDARRFRCEACGANQVYGLDELMEAIRP